MALHRQNTRCDVHELDFELWYLFVFGDELKKKNVEAVGDDARSICYCYICIQYVYVYIAGKEYPRCYT